MATINKVSNSVKFACVHRLGPFLLLIDGVRHKLPKDSLYENTSSVLRALLFIISFQMQQITMSIRFNCSQSVEMKLEALNFTSMNLSRDYFLKTLPVFGSTVSASKTDTNGHKMLRSSVITIKAGRVSFIPFSILHSGSL